MPSYVPTSLEFDYKTLPFQERKRIRDRQVAAQRRLIKRELEETGQTLSGEEINTRANNRADESLKNNSTITNTIKELQKQAELTTDDVELEMHVTDGPYAIEPSNSRFANLQNAVQTNR